MKKNSIVLKGIVTIALLTAIAITNSVISIIVVPKQNLMIDYQFNLFTVSSVFSGFAFSVMGLVLGLFSEGLIKKLEGTTLIQRKCDNIIQCIASFTISIVISLGYILGLGKYYDDFLNEILFINGMGFIIVGIFYFLKSVKSLFMIVGKIYNFNSTLADEKRKKYLESVEIIEKAKGLGEKNEDAY